MSDLIFLLHKTLWWLSISPRVKAKVLTGIYRAFHDLPPPSLIPSVISLPMILPLVRSAAAKCPPCHSSDMPGALPPEGRWLAVPFLWNVLSLDAYTLWAWPAFAEYFSEDVISLFLSCFLWASCCDYSYVPIRSEALSLGSVCRARSQHQPYLNTPLDDLG